MVTEVELVHWLYLGEDLKNTQCIDYYQERETFGTYRRGLQIYSFQFTPCLMSGIKHINSLSIT